MFVIPVIVSYNAAQQYIDSKCLFSCLLLLHFHFPLEYLSSDSKSRFLQVFFIGFGLVFWVFVGLFFFFMVIYPDRCRKTEACFKACYWQIKINSSLPTAVKPLGNSCQGITESYQCIVGPELLSSVGLIVYLHVLCAILACLLSFHMSEQLGE